MCFSSYGVHIPRKSIKPKNYYSCHHSPLRTPDIHFWKPASPTAGRGGENYDLIYQNSIRKYEDGTLSYYKLFIFYMIFNFGDVMNLQFCK